MPSTYSPNLRFELIAPGEQANTWGITTNNNIGALVEQALTGIITVDVSSGSVTLNALNGAVDQSRNMIIRAIGSPAGTAVIKCPNSASKLYVLVNDATKTVTLETVSGAGVDVSPGLSQFVFSDGSNVYQATTTIFDPDSALATDANGNIVASAVSTAQLNYLSGVTSDIQTQINTADAAILTLDGQVSTINGQISTINGQISSINSSLSGKQATISVSGILKGQGAGSVVQATAGTDYSAGTAGLSTGLLKSTNGTGALTIATAKIDYAPPTTASSIQLLAGDGAGGFTNIALGTNLSIVGNTLNAAGGSGGVTSVNGLTGAVTLNYVSVGSPSTTGANASGTWNIGISGTATYATYPASGGSFVTSTNIGSQSVNYANSAGSASSASSASTASYASQAAKAQESGSSYSFVSQADGNFVGYGPSGVVFSVTAGGAGVFKNMTLTNLTVTTGYTLGLYGGTSTNGAICTISSSAKYKEDIRDYDKGLAELLTLKPKWFTYKTTKLTEEMNWEQRPVAGLIAEEVFEDGFSEFVIERDGDPDTVLYDNLSALYINAIKELHARLEALEAKVG